jgi:nucleotide-binding universal stress UspA family protein
MSAQRVVVGVDGSLASFRALDVAAAEARRRDARLDVVMAVGDSDEPGPILRAAAARVATRCPGLTVRTSSALGDPADVLVGDGGDAVLVVVGSRGIGGAAGLLMRSVSQRTAARITVPLLVVRGGRRRCEAPPGRTGGVLLGLSPLRRAFPQVAVETRSMRSPPCRALIEATSDAQLVVVAAHRRNARLGIQLGPVTGALLHHSRCAVAVVPIPGG